MSVPYTTLTISYILVLIFYHSGEVGIVHAVRTFGHDFRWSVLAVSGPSQELGPRKLLNKRGRPAMVHTAFVYAFKLSGNTSSVVSWSVSFWILGGECVLFFEAEQASNLAKGVFHFAMGSSWCKTCREVVANVLW
jgi:hypothetical protein